MEDRPCQPAVTVPLFHLPNDRAQIIVRLFNQLMATKTVEESFAMLIDGKPTMDAYMQCGPTNIMSRLDVYANLEPKAECIEMFRSLLNHLVLWNLQVNASAAQTFQSSPENSQSFKFGLLELIACLLHDMAINIYEQYHGLKHVNELRERGSLANCSLPSFYHPKYKRAISYPRGLMKLIGYWMEMRVFEGVVVFEHGNPPEDRKSAWIHFPFKGLLRLSDMQLNAFAQLGSSTNPAHAGSVLPFPDTSPDRIATQDAYDLGLFRNIYEHVPIPRLTNWRCVRTTQQEGEIYPDWLWEDAKE